MNEKVNDNCCRKSHLSSWLGNTGGVLRVQICSSYTPGTFRAHCLLGARTHCCALVLVVVLTNHIQQALLPTAVPSPSKILEAWTQIIPQSVRLSKQGMAIIQLIA